MPVTSTLSTTCESWRLLTFVSQPNELADTLELLDDEVVWTWGDSSTRPLRAAAARGEVSVEMARLDDGALVALVTPRVPVGVHVQVGNRIVQAAAWRPGATADVAPGVSFDAGLGATVVEVSAVDVSPTSWHFPGAVVLVVDGRVAAVGLVDNEEMRWQGAFSALYEDVLANGVWRFVGVAPRGETLALPSTAAMWILER